MRVLRQIAGGTWQPRFDGIKSRAQQELAWL